MSAWNELTENQKKDIRAEYDNIVEWEKEQRKKREAELKATNRWETKGLDANQKAMADIIAERNNKIKRLRLKYDLDDGA